MSCTETKRSRNRGTVNSSLRDRTCKKTSKTSTRNEKKISKYFPAAKKDADLEDSDELSDSPYKSCFSDGKSVKLNNSASDLDDFKTPKAINKVSKIASKPTERNVKKKKSRQLPLRKFVEDNLKHSDVNPEHLQMALALSESTYEAENPRATQSSQEKKESFKLAFEKFGFGYSKSRVSVENRRELLEAKKINKKSRYRFVTPILKIRTSEEREALISSKVSLILAQNDRNSQKNYVQKPEELFCKTLQTYTRQKIFELNATDISELKSRDAFYVDGLALEISHAPCGYSLKNWNTIPGRERSPEPNSAPPTSQTQCAESDSRNSASTSKDHSVSTDSSFEKVSVVGSCSTYKKNSTQERLSLEINSPLEKLPSTSKEPQNPSSNLALNEHRRSSSTTDLSSGDVIVLENSSIKNSAKCINIDSDESPNDEPQSKFKLSPINSPLSLDESISSNISRNLKKGDFTTSGDIPICRGNPPPVKMDISHPAELLEHPHTPAKNSTLSNGFPTVCSQNNTSTTPPHGKKRSHDCLSPDLFDSDEDQPPNRLRGGQDVNIDETECYDLTQSDNEEESFRLKMSDPEDSIDRRSDLNVTDYVQGLLSNYKEQACPVKKIETISTSEDESQPSHGSVYISDDELNYSSVFGTPHYTKKLKYDLSEDEEFELALAEGTKSKFNQDFRLSKEEVDCKAQLPPQSAELPPIEVSTPQNHPLRSPLTNLCTDNFSNTVDKPSRTRRTSTLDDSRHELSDDEEFGVPLVERIKSKYKEDLASFSRQTAQLPPLQASADQNHPLRPPLTNLCTDNFSHTDNKPSHSVTTPTLEDSFNEIIEHLPCNDTPSTSNASFMIKTKNVTPMANYDTMDTPKITKELDKYGLKPLRRQKGAKLLKYIYESTHPIVGDENNVAKKRRKNPPCGGLIGGLGEEGEVILERKQSKKFAGCPVPLHIVWHNFVMSNPKIRENILLYEPLQLEVLHSMLKDQGFKFNIQDLLAFLDKKCITIRTAQGQHHGKNPR